MNINLAEQDLSDREKTGIEVLLTRKNRDIKTDLEQIWYLMDLIWDDYACDSQKLECENIGKFYAHPVWILNGLFIEQDHISMGHRHAICDWIIEKNFSHIVDYGGGFGTLSRLIAQKKQSINIHVYEPHPSEFGIKRANQFANITMIEQLEGHYDCLISTDVLEHVPEPLSNFIDMVGSVKVGGYLIIANCFMPVIKCHLPQTFHFKYTFNLFARLFGLEIVGNLKGSHATIYKKIDNLSINSFQIRLYEKVSQIIFPFIEVLKTVLRPIKKWLVK